MLNSQVFFCDLALFNIADRLVASYNVALFLSANRGLPLLSSTLLCPYVGVKTSAFWGYYCHKNATYKHQYTPAVILFFWYRGFLTRYWLHRACIARKRKSKDSYMAIFIKCIQSSAEDKMQSTLDRIYTVSLPVEKFAFWWDIPLVDWIKWRGVFLAFYTLSDHSLNMVV